MSRVLHWARLTSAYRAVSLARLASRLASVSPAACSGEDTATSECQQHLVVVDRSAGRSALGSLNRLRLTFGHQQGAPIRWLTSIVVCFANRCDPRPPRCRTVVLTYVYTHPDFKCCVQATSSALPVQYFTLSAALSVYRNVVGISAFLFRLRRCFLVRTSGARRLFRVGSNVLVLRDIIRCAGELSKPSVGVLSHSRIAVGHFRPVDLL